MRTFLHGIGFVFMAAVGAGQAADLKTWRASDGAADFHIDHPVWQAKKSNSPFNVLSAIREDRQCYFDLDASDAPLDQYQALVQKYMKDQGATITSTSPLAYEFKTKDGKYRFVAQTRGMNCGKKSYLATMTCVRDNFDRDTADKAFNSMKCGTGADARQAPRGAPGEDANKRH